MWCEKVSERVCRQTETEGKNNMHSGSLALCCGHCYDHKIKGAEVFPFMPLYAADLSLCIGVLISHFLNLFMCTCVHFSYREREQERERERERREERGALMSPV